MPMSLADFEIAERERLGGKIESSDGVFQLWKASHAEMAAHEVKVWDWHLGDWLAWSCPLLKFLVELI